MKRVTAFLVCCLILISAFPATLYAGAEQPIEVYVLGTKLTFTVQPVTVKGSTMVQMRPIFEAMEYALYWNEGKKTITAASEGKVLNVKIGSLSASNSVADSYDLPVAPSIINNCTMVPLRFIAEASGYQVDWDEANRRVKIEFSESQKQALNEKKTAIKEDLMLLKEKLKSQISAFKDDQHIPKELKAPVDWESQMDGLIAAVPSMTIKDIEFTLCKLLNYIGDPNTAPYNWGAPLQPFSFDIMSDGIYLIDAAANYENVVGKKLTAINGIPLDKVIEKLEPLLPKLNKGWRDTAICNMLSKSGYLYITGILSYRYQQVSYTFGQDTVSTLYHNILYYKNYVSMSESQPIKYPISYDLLKSKNWVEVLTDEQALFVKLIACGDWGGFTFQDLLDQIELAGKDSKIKTLILDMRDILGGGNSDVIPLQLSKAVKSIEKFTKPGGFYIISGRDTHELGVAGIYFLQYSNPVVIGQPSQWDHCYIGNDLLKLRSIRYFNLSKYYFEMSNDKGIVDPDILVTPTAAAFFAGRDECIEAAITDRNSKQPLA